MSPTDKIGGELRRIFLNKDNGPRRRTHEERYRDSVSALAVACLAAWVFFTVVSKISGGGFPRNVPLIGWALGLVQTFGLAAYWLLVAWWVYLDAKIRGMAAPAWGLLTLAMNVFGLVTYLVVRYPDPIQCEGCGRPLEPGVRMCPYCGAVTERVCPSCGAPIGVDWQFCPSCACVIPQRVATVQASGPRITPVTADVQPIDVEQRAQDIPKLIEQARASASSAQEAEAKVAQTVERIASGEVFDRRSRVTGCVFDATSGQPILGAAVRSDAAATPLTSKTDTEGSYAFMDLDPGPYVLIAEADGYHRATRTCVAPAGQSAFLDFRLVKATETAATGT